MSLNGKIADFSILVHKIGSLLEKMTDSSTCLGRAAQ